MRWLVGAALMLALAGCEKDPPSAKTPVKDDDIVEPAAPAVVIEQPGDAPSPVDPEPEPGPEQPSFGTTEIVTTQIPCQTDADCVKASCCHATSCVAAADAPDCSTATCTSDCRGGTMDCNGGCLCAAGRCAAKLWSAPEG